MKKVLTLSKEQARNLYNLLSAHDVPNRSDNRKRWTFLKVFEDFVFKFDDQINSFKGTDKDVSQDKGELITISKETEEFTFNDREVFVKVKDMFEKCYETGTKVRGADGKVICSPLVGRDAKVYAEIEDCFVDVKEIKKNK